MNTKEPPNTLTWDKNNKLVTIEKTHRTIIGIDKQTQKEVYRITQVDELLPRKRKPEHK